ncbi:hypothetical protein [Mucilaginibacter sp.]|uniref:hypothetical protein n=1 Tax=Mucilaginibacter sp. TaxID=1882438 RepID=UPI003B003568
MNKSTTANDSKNYIILTIAILIGLFGVYFRFFGDSYFYSLVSNIFFITAIVIALRSVFTILK